MQIIQQQHLAEQVFHRLSWGNVTLVFDNEQFWYGFQDGRNYYFEDIYGGSRDDAPPEFPERAQILTSADLMHYITVEDPQGHYRFDAPASAAEYLGVLTGYLSGPLMPETSQEAQVRIDRLEAEWQNATIIEE
ncbi:MAG: hypothetical protein J2P36_26200 [Ktedonobacteraceae bacterium]|nr:hypothetical protein [Ktedonobacteraceae bacterium]